MGGGGGLGNIMFCEFVGLDYLSCELRVEEKKVQVSTCGSVSASDVRCKIDASTLLSALRIFFVTTVAASKCIFSNLVCG